MTTFYALFFLNKISCAYIPQQTHVHQNWKTQERTTRRRAQAKGGIRAKKTAQIASKHLIYPELVNECKKQAKKMLGECLQRNIRTSEMEKKMGEEPLILKEAS